jgi:hypothetical protein
VDLGAPDRPPVILWQRLQPDQMWSATEIGAADTGGHLVGGDHLTISAFR